MVNRTYDIVVMGATGFSGKLLAEYLIEKYSKDVKIALAGRNLKRLETVRDTLSKAHPQAAAVPILIGDSGDLDSLLTITRQAKCVATTVGPYAKYGTLLVEACAKTGTHYCDLTGEPQWHSTMFNKYEVEAKKTGARIVHHCGFDSVPSDMGAMVAARAFRERFGKDAERIEMTIAIRGGGLQGGTLDTVLDVFQNGAANARLLAESRKGAPELQSKGKTTLEWSWGISWSAGMGKWCVPFFMASCNQPAVKKSNGRLGYAANMVYNERQAFPTFFHALLFWLAMALGLLLMAIPPTRWLLQRFVLPAPGSGPDIEDMKTKSYKVVFVATGGEDNSLTVRMNAVGDASCISTTCCLGESAMSLSKDAETLTSTGGVMTPAYAMDGVLLQRLKKSGKFGIAVEPAK